MEAAAAAGADAVAEIHRKPAAEYEKADQARAGETTTEAWTAPTDCAGPQE